jgi:hypothetical protein
MYPRIGWYYGIVGLVFQAMLIVFAVRGYRASRGRVALFAMVAVICYAIAASSWYTFPFTAGLFLGSHLTAHARLVLADSHYYFEQTFQILFAVFMVAALLSLTHERTDQSHANI